MKAPDLCFLVPPSPKALQLSLQLSGVASNPTGAAQATASSSVELVDHPGPSLCSEKAPS